MENLTIALIEDNETLRTTIADYVLGPAGYTVVQAADGATGLEIIHKHDPVLIVLDFQMPVMDGMTMVETLRNNGKDVPVILITAEGSEALASRAIRAGVSGYIPKPFEPEELLVTIENVLQRRRENAAMTTELQNTNRNLRRRIEQLEALQVVSQTISSSLNLNDVLTNVVEAAVKVTSAEEGSLLLLEKDSSELVMVAAKNFDDEFVRTFRIKSDDSLAGQVLRSGQPYLLDNSAPTKIKTAYLVQSLAYVPLKIHSRTIGVLGVDNRLTRAIFTEADLMPLNVLASYAAVAIENARLFYETEHKRATLETVFQKTEDAMVVLDNDFCIMLMNPAAGHAFGVDTRQVVGQPVLEIIANDDLEALLKEIDTASPKSRHVEITLPENHTLNAHLTSIEGIGWALAMQDITHLKHLDQIKSEFVSAVSHDIRSPLTAVLGYTELLPRVGPVTPQQQELIRRVRTSVNSITSLISDLLDLGKIEAGLDTQREEVDLVEMVQETVEELITRAREKQIILTTHLPGRVKPLYGNPTRLRQMVANLIGNAIKYTLKGGSVVVTLKQNRDSLLFTVRDTGIGITPEDQAKIFDKFYRSEEMPADIPGSGLGLSIVKTIVETHGGRIWLDSQLNVGSTFSVVLPLTTPEPA